MLIKYANANPCETSLFLTYITMQNVVYTMDQKIQTVQELVDALWKNTTVTEENHLWAFFNVFGTMIDELAFDKTKKWEHVPNHRFAQFIHFEFLPQYSKMLGFDLKPYQADARDRIKWNLNF